ncbi:MAG: CusA/CzcA family heavy metal efflux RND transporter [Nitrospinaceae bacterium]
MIDAIIKGSIRHWPVVLIASMALTLLSFRALERTPIDAIPDISDTQVIVLTEWLGRSPDLVEDQITYPIITALMGAPKVQYVRGQSFFGLSFINVIFDDGTDLYWARSRVLEYMDSVKGSLPEGINPELGPDATSIGWVYQYALVDRSGKRSLADLRSLQDWVLKFDLQSVPGVAEVASVGGFVKQYQVNLDPNKLVAYGITIRQVIQAVKKSNLDIGARVIEVSGVEHFIRGQGYVRSPSDLEAIAVGEYRGTPIFLRDMGMVTIGSDIRRGTADLDGLGETVGGIVIMRWKEDAKKVTERVKERIEALQATMPEGVEIVTVYDRLGLINRAIDHLSKTLFEEVVIVSLVILVFLWHFRSALIAVIPLPIAILISFIPMEMTGLTVNIMSLSGIAIAIGAMVDASIILVENAHKRLEEWEASGAPGERLGVIGDAMAEMGRPLFFSLLVITISFLPVFALTGTEGRLFTPLALTKTFAMAIAAVLAITLTPALAVPLLRGKIKKEADHALSRMLRKIYAPVCLLVLRYKKTTVAFALILLGSTVPVYMQLGTEFMPPLDEGSLLYMPTAVPGMSIEAAADLANRVGRTLKQVPEVEHIFTKVGRARTPTDPAPLSIIEAVIKMKPKEQWREGMTIKKLEQEMDRLSQIPGMPNIWWMPIQTRIEMQGVGIRSVLGIKVLGPDLETVEQVGKKIEIALSDLEGTRSVFAERATGGNFIDFDIDRSAIARFGLSMEDALQALSVAVGGMNVAMTVEGRERYPINVRYFRDFRQNLPDLERVLIPTPKGVHVPIGHIARLNIKTGPPVVRDENGKLASFVFIDINQKQVPLGDYVDLAKARVKKEVKIPTGVTLVWAGQYQHLQRAMETLRTVVPVTLLLVLLLIYFNTRNLTETLIVMLAVPFSLIGAFWLLYLLDYNLSVAVWVGIIALAGLDAETGVIMLLYLKISHQKWHNEGRLRTMADFHGSIMEGAVQRIRPKMMTAAAILLGLLPIMIGAGTGGDIMKRIAAPMVGGIITSVILELLVYPVIFSFWKGREFAHDDTSSLPADRNAEVAFDSP